MPYLNWISDKDLVEAVGNLLQKASNALKVAEDDFSKNVIDPFSALFQISGFNIDFENWVVSEKTRKSQKTLQNHIGDFHQILLGRVEGWENLGTGGIVDVRCNRARIIAEIKNKYNTTNASGNVRIYRTLESAVMPNNSIYHGYTAYFVTIIPKRPIRENSVFTPSDNETSTKLPSNVLIRSIDGASFYELVTGEANALSDLFSCLPEVIASLIGKNLSTSDKHRLDQLFHEAFG